MTRSPPAPCCSLPSTKIRPPEGGTSPFTTRSSVVLPQPLGPTMLRNSPSRTARSMPSKMTNGAPSRPGTRRLKFCNSRIGGMKIRLQVSSFKLQVKAGVSWRQLSPPRRGDLLDLLQYLVAQNAHEREGGDADDRRRDVERLPGEVDEIAHPFGRAEPLGDGEAGEAAPERELGAGKDEGEGRRQHDLPEEREAPEPERARQLDELAVGRAHAVIRVDENRKDAAQKDDGYFRARADAEPEQQHGGEGDARRGVERGHPRVDVVAHRGRERHQKAQRDADRDREQIAVQKNPRAGEQVRVELAGHEEHLVALLHDHERRDQKGRVGDDPGGEKMPQDEAREERERLMDGARILFIKLHVCFQVEKTRNPKLFYHSAVLRHGARFCSPFLIMVKLPMPSAASSTTVTNSFGLSQVSEASRSRYPSPALEASSSAAMTPKRARPTPSRMPVTINGSAAGRRIL